MGMNLIALLLSKKFSVDILLILSLPYPVGLVSAHPLFAKL